MTFRRVLTKLRWPAVSGAAVALTRSEAGTGEHNQLSSVLTQAKTETVLVLFAGPVTADTPLTPLLARARLRADEWRAQLRAIAAPSNATKYFEPMALPKRRCSSL